MTKEGNSLRFPELGGDSFCGGVFFSLPTASPFILASITGFVSRVAGRGSCYFGGGFFLPHYKVCGILIPQLGIESKFLPVKAWS